MTSDCDQAMFLIGASFEGSGIAAQTTLANPQFKPHAALPALLEWFARRGVTPDIKHAAETAARILWDRPRPIPDWRQKHDPADHQMALFD